MSADAGYLPGPRDDLGDDTTVSRLIAARVAATPRAVVAEHDGDTLSYEQLDIRSARLAARLREIGVRIESRVAIIAPPGLAILVAAVAVLRAGGAFVPIDPDYPPERVALILGDCAPAALLCPSDLEHPATSGAAPVILIDSGGGDTGVTPAPWPTDAPATADNAACVIYTSGSTAAPKGVVITHRGLANLALRAAARFALRPGDRFLQLASVSFSAFLEEVFPSVLAGATVIFAGYRRAMTSVPEFLDILRAKSATAFGITTAYWHELVDQLAEADLRLPPTVRFVLMGGEHARPDAVTKWPRLGVPLIHVYGPTEVTATATYFHSGEADPRLLRDGSLPLGDVITNLHVWLLDDEMRGVPRGEAGEVYVGGAGLARGYHASPGLTADRFVPDPHGEPGARLYRTGDLARHRPDGTLEFLGRSDSGRSAEVKLRGVRFQPAEVEAALETHPDVRRCAVVVRADDTGRRRLLAFLVPRPGSATLTTAALREHAAARLPGALVPTAFAVIDRLPLSANGKTDYAQLPEFAAHRPADRPWVAPRDETERLITTIWSDVLGITDIGAEDRFVELGGDSLLATRVLSMLNTACGLRLRPGDTLRAGSVRQLAALVDAQRSVPAQDDLVRARRRGELVRAALRGRGAPPGADLLSVSQQGLWVLHGLSPDSPRYNVALRLRLSGPLDPDALARAAERAVARHPALSSTFATVDGHAVQVASGAVPSVTLVDLSGLEPDAQVAEADRLITGAAARPFDLATGPLLRLNLLCLGAEEFELAWQAHHLVFDGWSARLLLGEIMAEYRGEAGPLPVATYADFVAWQRETLRGAELDRLAGYWERQLSGAPPRLDLSERPRGQSFDAASASLRLPLDAELHDALTDLGREEQATLFMVALAGFFATLRHRTGLTDICVGTPVANRPHPAFESVVGFFVNTIVVRGRFAGDPTVRAVIRQVRDTCLDGYQHGEMPFDLVVERLAPVRERGVNPLFQVNFAVDSAPGVGVLGLPGVITHQGREVPTGAAKFDLTWLVERQASGALVVAVEFDAALFTAEEIAALVTAYRDVLRAMVADPEARLSALSGRSAGSGREPDGTAGADLERTLCEMWTEAFNGVPVGPHDDFFEIGGYSLLASQLCARIGERFAIDLPLRAFFEAPTVAELAERVRAAADDGAARTPVGAVRQRSLSDLLDEIEALSDEQVAAAMTHDSQTRT